MEEITHFKFVDEKFTKHEIKKTWGIDPFADDATPQELEQLVEYNLETADELKKALSNNEDVDIYRETIVVSENLKKNTISFKRYFFCKRFVTVKGITKRKFKILRKRMVSLTINKINGEFSVYEKARVGKKEVITIRKNLSSTKIRSIINGLVISREYSEQISHALRIFANNLGYPNLDLTTESAVSQYFFGAINYNDKERGLPIFPFINYLNKNGITIDSYYALYYFETIFKKNKAKYFGCGIIDYMSYYYGIDDKILLQALLKSLIIHNESLAYNKRPKKRDGYYGETQSNLVYIDGSTLRVIYGLAKHYSMNPTQVVIRNMNAIVFKGRRYYEYSINDYSEILKYFTQHSLTIEDYLNVSDTNNILGLLYKFRLFDFFGIKPKINTIADLFEYSSHNKLFDLLFYAVNTSGTYVLDKKSVTKIKRYFENDSKINFLTQIKFKARSVIHHFSSFPTIYSSEYGVESLNLMLEVKNKKRVIVFVLNPIVNNIEIFDRGDNNIYLKGKEKVINMRKNKLALALNARAVYSKDLFEKLCAENNINLEYLIDNSVDNK